MKKLLLASLLVLTATCYSQTWNDTIQKLDKLFQSYEGGPGAQLAISRHEQVIFSKAWGLADMEHDVPLTVHSVTEAGSISKQIVAACILLLEQQGKLSLNDDVRKYLPELPDYGIPIRLRQMMQHTSGLRDWGAVASITGWPRSSKTYDNNDALLIASKQKTLNNIPGAEFIYSNTNYNLFAIIIERVSGLSLAKFSRQYIFEPAGMVLTQWRDDYKRIVKNRAIAYIPTATGYQTEMPNEYVYGNGGMLTTAEELLQWTNYYISGKLGSPSLLSKQIFSDPLINGNKNIYAAGLFIQTTNGQKDITHNGATAGYRADMHYFPDLGLSIAYMSNNGRSMDVVNEVINLFIPRPPVKPNGLELIAMSPAMLKNYPGWYRNQRSGESTEIISKDNNLFVQNQKMLATASNYFRVGQSHFIFNEKGFSQVNSANDTILYNRVNNSTVTEELLKEFAGTYYSEETDSKLTVSLVNGKLMAKVKPTGEIALTPTYQDGFNSLAGAVYFERDKKNKVSRMKISSGRARNVEFIKL